MKTIDQMTHEEVIALERDDLDRLVKLACAIEGVRLPGEPPEKPEEPKIERDAAVYTVGGLSFSDRSAAEAVGAALAAAVAASVKLEYDWQHVGSEHKYVRPIKFDDQAALSMVTTERALAESTFRRVRDELIQYRVMLKRYEDELKLHEQNVKESDCIRAEILAAFADARARQYELDRAKVVFDEYMRLADSDVEVAVKFFEKANKPSAWVQERMALVFEGLR